MSESNPIRVFATHAFDESDDYLRVFEFLESVDRFFYMNVSKPDINPASNQVQAVKDELTVQINAAEVIIILSDVYEQRPDIVKITMDVSEENNKVMIAISPFGGVAETPPEMLERCEVHLGWNARDIADTILFQARGKDTQRWDVVDFPGFDADGPTD